MGSETFGLPEREAVWLKQKLGLEVAVEGGTFRGGSAARLSETFSKVFTIEKSDAMFAEAQQRLAGFENVVQLHGDTREFLRSTGLGISRQLNYRRWPVGMM